MRIVLVEDNILLAEGIAKVLADEGHVVERLVDGEEADEYLISEGCDLAIIDINLPSISGLEVLSRLRTRGDTTPVMLLTARDGTHDRVAGLDAGADDYVVKPFEIAELEARVRALLRRRSRWPNNSHKIGSLEYDLGARRVFIGGVEVRMPRKELALLECLLDRSGRIVSKGELTDHLYGVGSAVEEHVIEVYISRLRKNLAAANVEIRTARGLGYMLEGPDK